MNRLFLLLLIVSTGTVLAQNAPLANSPANVSSDNNLDTVTYPPSRNIMPVTSAAPFHNPNPVPPPKEICARIDAFFNTLKVGSYGQAYEGLMANTRLGEQKDKLSAFVTKTESAFGIYGQMKDYELYDTYPIGSHVLVLTYLTRHSLQPLRWRLIYYQADTSWGLINMGFDDNLLELLN